MSTFVISAMYICLQAFLQIIAYTMLYELQSSFLLIVEDALFIFFTFPFFDIWEGGTVSFVEPRHSLLAIER